jgi:hypothetical protein
LNSPDIHRNPPQALTQPWMLDVDGDNGKASAFFTISGWSGTMAGFFTN